MRFAINAVREEEIASDISGRSVVVATDSSFNLEPIFTNFTADLSKLILWGFDGSKNIRKYL